MGTTETAYNRLMKALLQSTTEEDVKHHFSNFLKLKYNTKDRHDLYTKEILFEFKYDKNFQNVTQRAKILAQALYYIREIKFWESDKIIPKNIGLIDKNEALLTPTILWQEFYDSVTYDWTLSPSTLDIQLVTDLSRSEELVNVHIYKLTSFADFQIFHDSLQEIFTPQLQIDFETGGDKKIITEENFEIVYEYWKEEIFEFYAGKTKLSKLFLTDIQKGKTTFNDATWELFFNFWDGRSELQKVLPQKYMYFWSVYAKVKNPLTIRNIIAKIDRLTTEKERRFEGEFYTPVRFADMGRQYLADVLWENWYNEYKIWDMACGTGNLEYNIPAEAFSNLYLSTLHSEEVDYLARIFPWATTFQYDYLNDDVDFVFAPENQNSLLQNTWKLPQKLRDDLANPKNKWVVLINPPFATSQEVGVNSKSKASVSDTKVREYMHQENLWEVSRELFSQFIYRIQKEIPKVTLGMFSTIKYVVANNDSKLRDNIFTVEFKKWFIFSSENFIGTKWKFPVGFMVWDFWNREKHLEDQNIEIQVLNNQAQKVGNKILKTESKEKFLSNWFEREKNIKIFPSFKSAITISEWNTDTRDKISDDFIGSLDFAWNDVQNINRVWLYSWPFSTAWATSITSVNFEQALVIHAVRKITTRTWFNDRDQFMQPNRELPEEFVLDCIVWSLFANSNQTSSMKDVAYKGNIYQIINHFFPFTKETLASWECSNPDLFLSLSDRFVANYLRDKNFSPESQKLWNMAKKYYQIFFEKYVFLNTPKWKIASWDAGWYQIRNALAEANLGVEEFVELKSAHKELGDKIRPLIYEYGFLPEEKVIEEV